MDQEPIQQHIEESQQTWNLLTKQIEALKRDMALEMDGQRQVVLQERLTDLERRRQTCESTLQQSKHQPSRGTAHEAKMDVGSQGIQVPRSQISGSSFNPKRFLVTALVIMVLFIVTVSMLVWAAQQLSVTALVLVLIVAIVFDLVSVVTVLVMNGFLRQRWAIDFYNAVLGKIPAFRLPAVDSFSEQGSTDHKQN